MKLSILIPALNEEKTIGSVIEKATNVVKKITKIDNFQIIVINDGSTDKTEEIAKEKGATVVTHKINRGVGKSFQDGLEESLKQKTDILVTIDADGQFNPDEIPKLINPILKEEADFVTGSRFIDPSYIPKNIPWIKKWGNKKVAGIISLATGQKFYDVTCGFRAYNKEAMLRLNLFGHFTYTQETFLDLAHKGLIIKEIPIDVIYFKDRKSRVTGNIPKYALKSAEIIFKTIKDYKPLKFFGWSGAIIFTVGLVLDITVLNHFLKTGSFSPYKIYGFLGAFLNAIGIMIGFIGILADLIDKIRLNQEKIIYEQKKEKYE